MSSSDAGPLEHVADPGVSQLDRRHRSEEEVPVAARPARDQDVREDRRERSQVAFELALIGPVGRPLHHDPARLEVVATGLVVLVRRDHRGTRALDRRRRIGDDDVVVLATQLEVVAAVGDDDPPVRMRLERCPRPGSSSRTCRRPTGRARPPRRPGRRSAPTGSSTPSRTPRSGPPSRPGSPSAAGSA